MSNKYTVDRFEGDLAILLLRDDENIQIDVSLDQLPSETKEGDILELNLKQDGSVKDVKILKKETQSAKKRADNLFQKILNKNK